MLGIAEEKIGVDIELIKPRSEALLEKWADELELLGAKNWENFYRIWTAKEAILKASDQANLDKVEEIGLTNREKIDIKNQTFSFFEKHKKAKKSKKREMQEMYFDLQMQLTFAGKEWQVQS